jgi:hypothetical protein
MPDWSLARRGLPPTNLPAPGRGYTRTLDKIGGTHSSLKAARTRDVMGRKRTYTLPWEKLTDAQWRLVEQYHDGSMGLGPFEYREPGQPMVLVNVDSLTDTTPLYANWHSGTLVLEQV